MIKSILYINPICDRVKNIILVGGGVGDHFHGLKADLLKGVELTRFK